MKPQPLQANNPGSSFRQAVEAAPNEVSLEKRFQTVPPVQDRRSIPEPPPVFYVESPPVHLADGVSEEASVHWSKKIFRVPAWSISMILHVVAILILAFIPLTRKIRLPFVISGNLGTADVTQPFEISNLKNDSLQVSENVQAVEVDLSTLNELDIAEASQSLVGISLKVQEIQPELGLGGRSGMLKSTLLAAYGGTAGTENAVKEGLAWLARQQRSDGSWSLRSPYTQGAVQENKVAATAMALIAFAGAGHTHRAGDYQSKVEAGLKFLIAQQDDEGFFSRDAPDRQQMYAHAQASIALSEIYGMTTDQTLRKPVKLGLDFVSQSQSREGGWRYQPRDDSDTSVTGWFVMALMSGQMCGMSIDQRVLENVHRFLDTVQSDNGSQYAYTALSERFPSYAMTAEGLLCREYLGWMQKDPRLVKGCRLLTEQRITTNARDRAYYYWYYATQTLHHFGGEPWQVWNESMRVALPELQVKEGKEKGSWPPNNDEHSSAGGRLYATCFAVYCLEVYYRHLPLYGLKN